MHRAETTFCTLQVLHIERRVNGSELQPFRAQSCGKSSMNANFCALPLELRELIDVNLHEMRIYVLHELGLMIRV